MPRSTTSPAAAIVEFFRTATFETADLVMEMSKAALKARKQKSAEAKARAAKPAPKPAPKQQATSYAEDLDDEIPF